MSIVSFAFDKDLASRFVDLPYALYCGDPNWIPQRRNQALARMLPTFPFYSKEGNRHMHFLASVGGRDVGRISAMVNRDLHDRDGTPVGCVGMFECIDDNVIARELLESATSWLRETCGIRRIWGPMDFDIWHGYRYMTSGFEFKPFVGEPYNKPYIPEFFLANGFEAKWKWDSIEISGRDALTAILNRGERRYNELIGRGYRIENFDMKAFDSQLKILYEALTRSFSGFLGFTPITYPEFEAIIAASRCAFDSRFFGFVYNERDELAGFAGAFLELSDALRRIGDRDDLWSRVQFLYHRRRVDRILFFFGGQVPEEQQRLTGSGRAAFHFIMKQILDSGYENVIIALRSSENKSRAFVAGSNHSKVREYSLFERRYDS